MEHQIVNKVKRVIKKKKHWDFNEESLFVAVWEDNIGALRGSRKNSHIYEEMALGMQSSGFDFTPEEIKIKVHNFTNKYRAEKRKVGPSGGSPSSWPFYERMHSMLGSYKSNAIENNMDESIEPSCSTSRETILDFEVETLGDESDELIETPPPKKKRKASFHSEILKKIQYSTEVIEKEIERNREVDARIFKLQEEMVEIEKERNDIFRKLINK